MLYPPRPDGPPRTPLGGGWRHELDIVLSADGAARVIHDGPGDRHVFVREPAADASATTRRRVSGRTPGTLRYRASPSGDGTLSVRDGRHVWHRTDGTRITFEGSVPVRIEPTDGDARVLRYAAGRLVSASDAVGTTLRFFYDGERLRTVSIDDGPRWRLTLAPNGKLKVRRDDPAGECAPDDTVPEESEPCDTDASPPGDDFVRSPGIPGALRIDARPASCRSYFDDHAGTARGFAIESGLDGLAHYAGYAATVRSFPIVDFVGAELRVVRSRDLASPSYDGVPDALYARLLADGDEIDRRLLAPLERDGRLSVTELGRTTTLERTGGERVVLELVVRHGLASVDQIAQIERARVALAARHGIVLRVIEIP